MKRFTSSVADYLSYLKKAFSESVAVYIVALFGTYMCISGQMSELFKYSSDYFLFLVLYPISLCIVINDHYKYFMKQN